MSNVLRVAIVDPSDGTRASLKNLLLSMDSIWLEAECSRYEFFTDVISQTTPDIGIVVMDQGPQKALAMITEISRNQPECSILVISSSTDSQLILQAMRAGVKEFLTQPVRTEDLVAAIDRITESRYGRGDSKSRGCQVISVCGATGGVGSTSIAVNLGCVIAQDQTNSVCLVDLDLALGDADVFLDTIPEYTIADVAQNISRLDFGLLKRSLTKHASGLYLLPRPVQLQDAQDITPDDVQRMIGLLKATFTHVIIDNSKSFTPLDFVAMQMANVVLMITQLDLPCLRNVVRLLSSFQQQDGLKEKVKVLVNRVGIDSGHISLKKAQETFGQEIYWQLPNDYRVMVDVRNNGVPLIEQAPRAGLTQSIIGLSNALKGGDAVATTTPAAKAGLGKWLGFLPGKNKPATPPQKPAGKS